MRRSSVEYYNNKIKEMYNKVDIKRKMEDRNKGVDKNSNK